MIFFHHTPRASQGHPAFILARRNGRHQCGIAHWTQKYVNHFCTARVAPEKAVFRPALPLHLKPELPESAMAAMTYREQLLHPNWQRKRLEIMQRDEFRCQMCMDDERTLHVHHKQYAKGKLAWEYPNDELVTLCEVCHEAMGEVNARLRDVVAKLPVDGPGCTANAIGILAGWANNQQTGMDFVYVRGDEPIAYMAGEVACLLERYLQAITLAGLADALWDCPRQIVEDATNRFVQDLVSKKGALAE